MSDKSPIEWTDATWNPIVGCSIVSPGCTHCYAMKMAGRIEAMATGLSEQGSKNGGAKHYAGTTKKVNGHTIWTGKVALAPDHILLQPLAWRVPRRIFVNSMGDLFHENVPDEWIDRVFAVMALAPQHTFQVLTKRAKRMREYMTTSNRKRTIAGEVMNISEALARQAGSHKAKIEIDHFTKCFAGSGPFANVWLGVSAERQQEADERIPELLATLAAVRFISAEPLLGPIDFTRLRPPQDSRLYGFPNLDAVRGNWFVDDHTPDDDLDDLFDDVLKLDWIIVGGESGPDARPMHPSWPRAIRDQCQAAGVSFFFKQWGEWTPGENVDSLHGIVKTAERFDDKWLFGTENMAWTDGHIDDQPDVYRVGKKAAGRLLDGVEHNDMPELREVHAL